MGSIHKRKLSASQNGNESRWRTPNRPPSLPPNSNLLLPLTSSSALNYQAAMTNNFPNELLYYHTAQIQGTMDFSRSAG